MAYYIPIFCENNIKYEIRVYRNSSCILVITVFGAKPAGGSLFGGAPTTSDSAAANNKQAVTPQSG